MAPAHLLEATDGNEEAFHKRYLEDKVLGQGEFGVVKLVRDMQNQDATAPPLACKTLRKGAVFKDNTLYSPIKPEILRGEIEILRKLRGEKYCLKLQAVFETPKLLLVVTEYCGGGEMLEWAAKQTEDLRTEDVSRIAFQMLSALDHCARARVIHRDIKPENCMFMSASSDAELRLIDFGSGTMDPDSRPKDQLHTTYAGSAFYISPELFQRNYNHKTDIWSVGVALYVLVAGYPSECLQKAFNILQKGKRKLQDLPNMPDDMPGTFFQLLEGALTYNFRKRPPAGDLLENDFVQFHKSQGISITEVSAAASAANTLSGTGSGRRTASMSVRGSVTRHTAFMDFKKFERSLTTLLATMLTKSEFNTLLGQLKKLLDEKHESVAAPGGSDQLESQSENPASSRQLQRLHVLKVNEVKTILVEAMKNEEV